MALYPDPAVRIRSLLGTSKTSWFQLQGCSCLIRASKDGHLEMVQELLSAGADYDAVEEQVLTFAEINVNSLCQSTGYYL